jgi:hypothetical protein
VNGEGFEKAQLLTKYAAIDAPYLARGTFGLSLWNPNSAFGAENLSGSNAMRETPLSAYTQVAFADSLTRTCLPGGVGGWGVKTPKLPVLPNLRRV